MGEQKRLTADFLLHIDRLERDGFERRRPILGTLQAIALGASVYERWERPNGIGLQVLASQTGGGIVVVFQAAPGMSQNAAWQLVEDYAQSRVLPLLHHVPESVAGVPNVWTLIIAVVHLEDMHERSDPS